MKKENCIFQKIYLFEQPIKKEIFSQLFEIMYNSICFSTFPYIIYNQEDSIQSFQNLNSGNCISFCYFIKTYLYKNYNIKSFIIPASVPSTCKVIGTPQMCHCAILVPISLDEFYIIDGALYFLEPIYCSLKNNIKRNVLLSDAYNHTNFNVTYSLQKCSKQFIDEKYEQFIPNKTICTSCFYTDNIQENWKYYLCEILNPDYNIGYSFLKNTKNPFLMKTYYEDKIVKLKYKIKLNDKNITIYEYPYKKLIYDGPINSNNIDYMNIIKELHPYFLDYIAL